MNKVRVLSVSLSNNAIKKGQSERAQLNMLEEIINATNNENPIINDSLKGKTVVIYVWATWFTPCIQEIPKLNELVEDFKSEEVIFIALNKKVEEKEREIMEAKDIQFDYDLYFDQSQLIDLLYSFKLKNESTRIPLNIVINMSGQPAFYYMGNQPDKLEEIGTYLFELKTNTVRLL